MFYESDLAHVHDDGFGFHWQGAAPAILQWLRKAGICRGAIIDLGCGGGQWLARLAEAGYSPIGVDVSPAMIRIARARVPSAEVICGSFAEAELPVCDAVTSLGEPFNYLSGAREVKRTSQHIRRALAPGGMLIFDVREPATKTVDTRVVVREGTDWTCIAQVEESPATQRIVRRITTFRRHGTTFRRSEEIHKLQLYPRHRMPTWLQDLGFRVRIRRGYGPYRLGPRQVVFVARKPKS